MNDMLADRGRGGEYDKRKTEESYLIDGKIVQDEEWGRKTSENGGLRGWEMVMFGRR